MNCRAACLSVVLLSLLTGGCATAYKPALSEIPRYASPSAEPPIAQELRVAFTAFALGTDPSNLDAVLAELQSDREALAAFQFGLPAGMVQAGYHITESNVRTMADRLATESSAVGRSAPDGSILFLRFHEHADTPAWKGFVWLFTFGLFPTTADVFWEVSAFLISADGRYVAAAREVHGKAAFGWLAPLMMPSDHESANPREVFDGPLGMPYELMSALGRDAIEELREKLGGKKSPLLGR